MADSDDKKQARLQQEAEMDEVFKSEQTTIVPVDLDGEMKKSFIGYFRPCPSGYQRRP